MEINAPDFPVLETCDDHLFMLITGARGCLGYSIALRLLHEFILSSVNSTTKKLTLIICTRSSVQSKSTISNLQADLKEFVTSSQFIHQLRRKAATRDQEHQWQKITTRTYFLGVNVDLCDIKSIYTLADALVNSSLECSQCPHTYTNVLSIVAPGSVKTPGNKAKLNVLQLPRIDVVIFTAGIGGWSGIKTFQSAKDLLFDTFEAVTRPTFKISRVGARVMPQLASKPRESDSDDFIIAESCEHEKCQAPPLGEVFCSNVFGHYLLAHELMPLLSQPASASTQNGAKIIWVSSIANFDHSFQMTDFQALSSLNPYESSKRLIDLLILPSEMPFVQSKVASFFEVSHTLSGSKKFSEVLPDSSASRLVRPKNYVVHPGIFASDIMPLNFLAAAFCKLIFYIVRWLGSPWHTILPYNAAIAPARLALASNEILNEIGEDEPTKYKWGSATDSLGNPKIKKTEVPGWGWNGDADTSPDQEMIQGRLKGAITLRKEAAEAFELLSAQCWQEMEKLRGDWENILGLKS